MYTSQSFFRRALVTIRDIRSVGKYWGDLVLMVDDFNVPDYYIRFYKLIVRKINPIDTSYVISQIKIPFVNNQNKETTKTKQFNKFFAFDTYFRRWKILIFIDAGLRLFDNLEYLLSQVEEDKIVAMDDADPEDTIKRLNCQFDKTNIEVYNKLDNLIDLNARYFLNCMFIYPSSIIEDDTVDNLIKLMNEFPICRSNDMAIINIYFTGIKKIWKPLQLNLPDGRKRFGWSEHGKKWYDYIALKYPVTIPFE